MPLIQLMEVTVSPAITTEMLEPLLSMYSANIAIIMPVALGLYMTIKGIGLIPRIIGIFIH